MKKSYFVLLTMFIVLFSLAQEQAIEVEYEKKISFDLEDNDGIKVIGDGVKNDEIKKALKAAMEEPNYYKLITTSSESTWQYIEKIDNSLPQDGAGISISFHGGGDDVLYKNLKENRFTDSKEFFGKKALIKDSLKTIDWKITREKKEILGYEVRKATVKKDSTEMIAWYAPKLNYKNGPDTYGGLPGLILDLKVLNGKETYTYKAISLEPAEKNFVLQEPKKGKVYSNQEFKEESEKQSKKLMEMYGGGVDTSE